MARKVREGVVLIWGPTGAAVVLRRMAPGVIHLIGVRNFDGPFEDGPMSDFDREIAAHGSLQLFMDVRKTQRSSGKSPSHGRSGPPEIARGIALMCW